MEGSIVPVAGTPASSSALPAEMAKAAASREPVSLYPSRWAFGPLAFVVAVASAFTLYKFRGDSVGLALLVGLFALVALYVGFTAVRRIDLDPATLTLVPLLSFRPKQAIPLTAVGPFGVVQRSWAERWNLRRFGADPPPLLRASVTPGAFKLFGIWPQKSLTIGMIYGPAPGRPALRATSSFRS